MKKVTQEELNDVVQLFYKNVGKEIDMKNEYNLIQEKKSNLSRSQREAVVALCDIAKEHNLEI